MITFMSIIMMPLAILNALGGVCGLIWLAYLGDWKTVFIAFAAILFSMPIVSILTIPSMIIAIPAISLSRNDGILAFIGISFGLLSLFVTFTVMVFWCYISFDFFLNIRGLNSSIPYILVGYTVGTAPWNFMAQKEAQQNEHSGSSAAALTMGAACLVLFYIFDLYTTTTKALITLSIPMAFVFLIQSINVVIGTIKG